jgi:hypothetical protein
MRNHLLTLALASTILVSLQCGTNAAPVTAADLSGKKICWSDGNVGSYFAGGKLSSKIAGEGTWEVTSLGLHILTPTVNAIRNVEKLPDGTFSSQRFSGSRSIEVTGKICN